MLRPRSSDACTVDDVERGVHAHRSRPEETPFTSLLSFLLSLPAAAAGTEADEPPDEGGASRPRLARQNGDAGAPAIGPAVQGP